MKNIFIILMLAFIGISANLENDTKIGYVYMDLVLRNMEEAKEMNLILDKFSQEKSAELEKSKIILERRFGEIQKKAQTGTLTEAGKIIATNELEAMQKEIELQTQQDEQELYTKRVNLLTPIAKKLEEAMDKVAGEKGYKYVLNSSDGTGNSIVVVAPESDDLTQEVMAELGIELE